MPSPREREFLRIVSSDPDVAALTAAMSTFGAPDCWLVSGALFQTVWNVLDGRPQGHGILDYDLFYFDDDASYEAEDRWIKKAERHFAGLPKKLELRNQARVHLWYSQKFGVDYPKLATAYDGVRQFLLTACMVAVRPQSNGALELFAPVGVDDIFDRILRPNPLWQGPPRREYLAKVERYMRDWPSLKLVGEGSET